MKFTKKNYKRLDQIFEKKKTKQTIKPIHNMKK